MYAASLGMDGVGVYCSWEMPGPSWVDPPPSPALRRSWGKVLVCHKGLGGVFCVSGPRVCQPKALGWSTSWRIFGCNWPLSHSWLDHPSCTVVPSHSSALLFFVISFPSCPRVGSCFPTPFTFLHLAPLSPHFFFVPSHPIGFPLRVTSHFFLCRSIH